MYITHNGHVYHVETKRELVEFLINAMRDAKRAA
jgi:hypothetical protein